jgi:hypothetical protein
VIRTFPLSGNISQKTNLPTICQLFANFRIRPMALHSGG